MALKPRVVVVGLGSIGRRHARLLRERGDLQVEWCEPEQRMIADAVSDLGAPACIHREFDSMMATGPAVVVLATPHPLHAPQAIAALASGAHVLCEKPMADEPGAARQMAAAAKTAGRVLNIGFQLHFHPGLRRLKELIATGALGTVAHCHCRVGSHITLANSRTRYQRTLDGALMFDYAHQLDLLYWFLRTLPVGVHAIGTHLTSLELHSNPNVLSLSFDYAQPLLGTIHLNYLQSPERHHYEVVGDEGWAALDMGKATLTVGMREGVRSWEESFDIKRDALYSAEHQAFLDAVSGRSAPESPPDEAMASVFMTAAALSSWRSQRRVPVDAA